MDTMPIIGRLLYLQINPREMSIFGAPERIKAKSWTSAASPNDIFTIVSVDN